MNPNSVVQRWSIAMGAGEPILRLDRQSGRVFDA